MVLPMAKPTADEKLDAAKAIMARLAATPHKPRDEKHGKAKPPRVPKLSHQDRKDRGDAKKAGRDVDLNDP